MAVIDQATIQGFLSAGAAAVNTTEKGRALEDLICYLFALVPGIAITRRNTMNVFNTEEIDVALWNDVDADGLGFLPNIILVECKNWSNRVGSGEVNWFDSKLRNRGLDFGIFVSTLGITGDAVDLTAAHAVVAAALRERRRLVIVTVDELLALNDTAELAHLLKEKLCDLAVRGAIG
jgi:Restriction endonuclease